MSEHPTLPELLQALPQMRPVKHSLTLKQHRTSVSLEPEFWQAFQDIAKAKGQTINGLASEIDAALAPDVGLASAMRVFVLRYFQSP